MRFLAIGGKRFLITLGVLAIATCGARGEEGWLIDTVDSSPHMLGYASMATLSSGYPAIAYVEFDPGSDPPVWTLKYAWSDGGGWNITPVASGQWSCMHISLAILPSDNPAISYYEYSGEDLIYTWFDGGTWQSETVDSDGRVGEYNSLAIQPSGYPAISYRDATLPALKYAWHDGSTWHVEIVAGGPADYTSLAFLPSDRPAIAYRGNTYPQDMKYAWFDGSNWQTTDVDVDADTGRYASLAVFPTANPSPGQPAVSYGRFTLQGGSLKYAWFDGATWHTETVDDQGDVGYWTSLAILAAGQPAISYAGPRYAWLDGDTWRVETVDPAGGTQTSMVILPSGRPAISYISGNELRYAARCLLPNIVQQPLDADYCQGQVVTFAVVAEDDPPYDYQWRKDGVDLVDEPGHISGATTHALTITNIQPDDQGDYDVLVSNACGSTASDPATLRVADAEPTISAHPQGEAVCGDGSYSVVLSVTAAPEPLSYQWYKKGDGALPGETGSSLEFDPITPQDAGMYYVVVTNPCGSATSYMALLTVVPSAPVIVQQPQGQALCPDESVAFNVEIEGAGGGLYPYPVSYQWRKDGVDIAGATDDGYTIDAVTADDAGAYDVVITNACGMVTSDAAMLTVGPPRIEQHPGSQIVCAGVGLEVTLDVAASGAEPLAYQWYRKGSGALPGEIGPTLTIPIDDAGATGMYYVVVTDACGLATSHLALLIVLDHGPTILTQPQDQVVCDYPGQDDPVTFSVSLDDPNGHGVNLDYVSYQWRKDGEGIPGAIGSVYIIDSVTVDDAGVYDVVVYNACGSVDSDPATLTVADSGPDIQLQPQPVIECAGNPVTLTAAASTPGWLQYQWRKNGQDLVDDGRISGTTTDTLTIDPVEPGDQGNYDVALTNTCESVVSDAALLTVADSGPSIQAQPQPITECVGNPVTLTVGASAPGWLQYQWRKDGQDLVDDGRITGATTDTLTINPVELGDQDNYDVVLTNPCDTLTSDPAMLTVIDELPSITGNPNHQAACEDDSVTFTVTVAGPGPFEYQWRKDGSDLVDDGRISGATTDTLTINLVQLADDGYYSVEVNNPCGSDLSQAARLIVGGPFIGTHPQVQTVCEDSLATFSVAASGAWPLAYQWRKDGANLANDDHVHGATTDTLTIDPARLGDVGQYDVVVSNPCGSLASQKARLNVNAKLRISEQPESAAIVIGQTHTFCLTATGFAPLSYQWRKDGADIAGANADCYQAQDAGVYQCVVTNACGSITSEAVALTVVPVLAVTITTASPAIKLGDSAALTATPAGGLAPYTYAWNTQQTTPTITVSPVKSTVYSVTVTDALQQTATAKLSITVVLPMTVTARASAYTLAPGESSTLTAVIVAGGRAPFTYAWSTGETTASITVRPTVDTTYTVVVTDSLGQAKQASVTLTMHDPTAAPPSQPDTGESAATVPDEGEQDGAETPPGDTDGGEETGDGQTAESDQPAQEVPSLPGLCPAFSLVAFGLTLVGLWWTRPATRRGQRRRG